MAVSAAMGKILYALAFCLLLPLLLVLWASSGVIGYRIPDAIYGWPALLVGAGLMLTGMTNLWTYGKGLPMNAFPPERLVREGAFRLLPHPIYTGFCLMCAGVSIILESPTGLYLTTPIMALCCFALVHGHERIFLLEKFGNQENTNPSIGFGDRLISLLPLWLTWLIGYEFLIWKGFGENYVDTVMTWEQNLPVIEWMEIPYVVTYPFVVLPPLFVSIRSQFSQYLRTAWFLIPGTLFLEFLFPFYASPRPFHPSGWLGEVIMWERFLDGPAASFPSFHVVWVFLSAHIIQRAWPRLAVPAWSTALLIALSCVLTGAHSTADVLAGAAFYFIGDKRLNIIESFQRWCERLANSWSEWRLGSFRIINHAWYSGLAGFTAGVILSQFTRDYWSLDFIILAALAGGAIWGQWVEGSSSMLRPFGFYGGLLGGMAAMVLLWILTGVPMIYWLAVFSMATPMAQAIGRLRCLVQGCCHGRETIGSGIIYENPHTRVGQISWLKGKCIHNTQAYSIVSNLLTTIILFRLQWEGASCGLLAGLYFILTGAFRFIEEAYRGEPQTRILYGLRLYQWMALASVIFGAVLTTIKSDQQMLLQWNISGPVWAASLIAGLAWAFGMSMDFPESTKRYSRLTG